MESGGLEEKIKVLTEALEKQEAKVKMLTETAEKQETRLQKAEDIEAIKKLQRSYCYYLEHWQDEEIIGLFSHSPDVSIEINDAGQYKGWEEVKIWFPFADHHTAFGVKKAPPEFLHLLIPLSGIVDIDPDGVRAKGRWYGFGLSALPREGKLQALIGCGIWGNDYVKEDGKWKILKLFYNDIISSPIDKGWVKKPWMRPTDLPQTPPSVRNPHLAPYPSGTIFPYHYKNPVTGK